MFYTLANNGWSEVSYRYLVFLSIFADPEGQSSCIRPTRQYAWIHSGIVPLSLLLPFREEIEQIEKPLGHASLESEIVEV